MKYKRGEFVKNHGPYIREFTDGFSVWVTPDLYGFTNTLKKAKEELAMLRAKWLRMRRVRVAKRKLKRKPRALKRAVSVRRRILRKVPRKQFTADHLARPLSARRKKRGPVAWQSPVRSGSFVSDIPHVRVQTQRGNGEWRTFAMFPKSPEGRENAKHYARMTKKKYPLYSIRVVE